MSDSNPPEIPDFATLAADPEIAALLDFDPAVRQVERPNGWTPELQRELIARIVDTGSPGHACEAMDKNLSGAKHLYRSRGADSFRQAWTAAIALGRARKRAAREATPRFAGDVPGIAGPGSRSPDRQQAGPLSGQVMNEHGEWEDERSLERRGEEARDSISNKLLRARRLYLQEISSSPGKRAAFEILTDLPVDWDKAAALEPQADEPWRRPNMRQGDMLVTAENGWLGGLTHGPDKMAELRRAIDEYRAQEGLEPVEWEGDGE